MANTIENLYVGDGVTVLYSFTFPYIDTTDVKVSLDVVDTTEYSLANATTVEFNTPPADGVEIRIYRRTDTDNLKATFFPGSVIRAQDLNDDFEQSLYVAQESQRNSELAYEAYPVAAEARDTANNALSVADAAAANVAIAVSTANGAVTTANSAATTANNASTDAANALITANSAAAAVSDVVTYTLVANVAAIPASPADGDRVEVTDSTGIESFTPLAGVPSGFVGDNLKAIRITYDSVGVTWNWNGYVVTDPDARYAQISGQNFTGSVVAPNFIGSLTGNVSGNSNGTHTGPVTGDVTGNTAGTHTGPVVGDVTGSSESVDVNDSGFSSSNNRPIACFGSSSDPSVNTGSSNIKWAAANHPIIKGDGQLTANGGFVGNLTGNVTGNVTGDLTGVANAVAVGGTINANSKRPIACWGSGSDGGGDTSSNIKIPIDGADTATIRGDGTVFSTGLTTTGNVSVGGVIGSAGMGRSLANVGQGAIGATVLAGKIQDTGAKTIGDTISGSSLRPASGGGDTQGSGSLNGTWRCQGYAGNNTSSNFTENSTTCWIRIA